MTGVLEAKGLWFKSGKYHGLSMNEIAERYPEYIVWCYKSVSGKMGIPHALYVWADNQVRVKRASVEVRIRDAEAAQDFAPCAPPLSNPFYSPPDQCRGVFVGDSGSNQLTPFQTATLKAIKDYDTENSLLTCRTYVDEFGITRVVRQEIKPLVMPEPEGEPSIFQQVLEGTTDDSTSFLNGIL